MGKMFGFQFALSCH